MKSYKLEEVFRLAINMEEQGRNFYQAASQYARQKSIKNLFSFLAKEEVRHAKVFLKLYKIYARKKSFFPVDARLEEFLDTLLRGLLVPDIAEVRDALLKNNKSKLTALIRIAMDVELNTILFYQKLKEIVRGPAVKEALTKIIREEEKHLVRLKNVRLDLDPFYAGLQYGTFF